MNWVLSALLNGAIVSAGLTLAIALALWATPRRALNASARYAIWWIVLLATALLPLAYVRFPRPVAIAKPAPAVFQHTVPFTPMPASTPIERRQSAPAAPRFRLPISVTAGSWSRWIPVVWSAISTMLLLRLAFSCLFLGRRKSEATPVAPPISTLVNDWLATRRARPVRVLSLPTLATPVLAGLRRPAILIPESLLAQLCADELRQVAIHEAAHLARRDDYTLVAQRVLQAVLWPNPAVRFIARQLDIEREIACDDLVVDAVGVPHRYAACLTRIVELCGGVHESWAGAGVAGNRSQLAKRINGLLDRRRSSTRPAKHRFAASLTAVGLIALLAARIPQTIALAAPPSPPPQQRPAAAVQAPLPQPPQPAAAVPIETPRPQERSASPVFLPVTVHDNANRSIAGLTAQDFRLFDNGIEQQIDSVSQETEPLSIAVLVDVSGSMRDKHDLVSAAVLELIKALDPRDEILAMTVNNDVHLAGPFSGPNPAIADHLLAPVPRGGSALRDAIYRAMQWNARYEKRALILITDGDDNSSSTRMTDLQNIIAAGDTPPVLAIQFASSDTRPESSRWMIELAQESGGRVFVVDSAAQAASAAASILPRESRYLLKFQPNVAGKPSQKHAIRIDVAGQPGGPLRVSAREFYYPDAR